MDFSGKHNYCTMNAEFQVLLNRIILQNLLYFFIAFFSVYYVEYKVLRKACCVLVNKYWFSVDIKRCPCASNDTLFASFRLHSFFENGSFEIFPFIPHCEIGYQS